MPGIAIALLSALAGCSFIPGGGFWSPPITPTAAIQTTAFFFEAFGVVLACDALFRSRTGKLAERETQLNLAKEERRRLLSLFRQVPASIHLLRGEDLVVELAHPKAVEALGNRDIEGKPLLDAIPEFRGISPTWPGCDASSNRGSLRSCGNLPVYLDDPKTGVRRETFWHSTYQPVRDQSGKVEGVLAFDIEVTDEVRQRRQLELLQSISTSLSRAVTLSEVASVMVKAGNLPAGRPSRRRLEALGRPASVGAGREPGLLGGVGRRGEGDPHAGRLADHPGPEDARDQLGSARARSTHASSHPPTPRPSPFERPTRRPSSARP